MRRSHPTLFTPRHQAAGWGVIQSHTLLQEAIRNNKNPSFLMYSAFEMRNAIEQIMFTIIAACLTDKFTQEVVDRCRKKDGLFKVLSEIEPNYTLLCQFANALRTEQPFVPKMAEWDIKILKRRWNDLSTYCHSPLVMKDVTSPKWFEDGHVLIEKVYDYISNTLSNSAGTGFISSSGDNHLLNQLQDDFMTGKITIEQVIIRLRLIKPMLPKTDLEVRFKS